MDEEFLNVLRERFKPREGTLRHEPLDYLYEFADIPTALMCSALFVPDFIEVDGSVLLDKGDDTAVDFRTAKQDTSWPLAELEASFNWVEVAYLFADRGESNDSMLAEKIAEAWRGRLKHLFPQRSFAVVVMPPEDTGSVIGVGFTEVRSSTGRS